MKIANRELELPILQGGMGVGVSLGNLAGRVASYGAMGTISAVGIGFKEDDFETNTWEANKRALNKEIQKAKDMAGGKGLVAVNVMMAITDYDEVIKQAVSGGADVIVVGAGLPLNLPELVEEDTLIAPIVSGARALKLICRRWKTYNRLPDFVVLEGAWAGGHLGFSAEDIDNYKEDDLLQETKDARAFLDTLKEQKDIPLFVAGNVFDEQRIKKLLEAGADGFQFGTPFIATQECDVSDLFKKVIVDAKKEDIVLINSPVGMPARALATPFVIALRGEKQKIRDCRNCLRFCTPAATEFCISKALIHAAKGNYEEGLFFAGDGVDRIHRIKTVKEVIDEACLFILRAGGPDCGHGEGSLR